jgi:hypothetical protein
MKQKAKYLIFLFTLLALTGCKDKDEKVEVEELIDVTNEFMGPFLGEWKEIAYGNDTYPAAFRPNGYLIEFLGDRTMPGRIYHSSSIQPDSFRLDAEYLYINSGKPGEGYTCRYSFVAADLLRLEIVAGAVQELPGTPSVIIYERVKDSELPNPFPGEWKEVARGNDAYPELPPDGHVIEFLPDGTIIYHGGWTRSYRAGTKYMYYDSEKSFDEQSVYQYSFTGTDTLRLDIIRAMVTTLPTTPHFNIYERITTNEP